MLWYYILLLGQKKCLYKNESHHFDKNNNLKKNCEVIVITSESTAVWRPLFPHKEWNVFVIDSESILYAGWLHLVSLELRAFVTTLQLDIYVVHGFGIKIVWAMYSND